MTTDYKNLTFFEAAAVMMIAIGVALVGFQFFASLPEGGQAKIISAMQVFEMSDAAKEAWSVETTANEYVFAGMGDFYEQFYLALGEVAIPVADEVDATADNFARVANAFVSVSDTIASNYKDNYAGPGVEAGMGGRVMGAYMERLAE
jgi:hypothetical protein